MKKKQRRTVEQRVARVLEARKANRAKQRQQLEPMTPDRFVFVDGKMKPYRGKDIFEI